MENGLRRFLGLWDAEPRSYRNAVSISSGCSAMKKKRKENTSDGVSHVCFSPGRRGEMARRQPHRCVRGPVITTGASKRARYRGSIANLHLLDIRAGAPGPAFIYCSPARDTGKPLNWFLCSS